MSKSINATDNNVNNDDCNGTPKHKGIATAANVLNEITNYPHDFV